METKVLSAIMKLQGAQIMLSNEGLHTNLSTNCIEHGSIELDAFTHNLKEEQAAHDILDEYDFVGATRQTIRHEVGTSQEFATISLRAYLSDIK